MTEYLGNFDDYVEKRDRPQLAPAAEGEVTRTAATRERKRDRQQAARARKLQAQVKRAEEAIEETSGSVSWRQSWPTRPPMPTRRPRGS